MLVLTRRLGESIVIDGNIVVSVVGIDGDRVRVGIEAPPVYLVDREEIRARRLKNPDGPPTKKTAAAK